MNSTNKTLKTLAVAFIIIALGLVVFFQLKKAHLAKLDMAREQSQNECLEIIGKLENDIAALRARLDKETSLSLEPERFSTVFGKESTIDDFKADHVDCDKILIQIQALFKYLDDRPYIASRNLKGGIKGYFQRCTNLLIAEPPANIAEMKNIFRLVKNVTHFYRVLGKNRLKLAKDIMVNENRVAEPALAVLYAWMVDCRKPFLSGQNLWPVERLYDYAGYFLNTLGGRSYMLRRESKVRMLVSYYSLLIIDKANEEKFNAYGIDIRPYIDFLFYDISNQKGLAYRERYMTRLAALRDKYL